MAKLLVKTEGVGNPVLELRLGVNRVGRGEDNHFQIHHHSISTHHCELELGDGCIRLRDCGSTNGTFINGERVTEAELRDGQTIHLGEVEILVETVAVTIAIPHYDRPVPAPPVVMDDGGMICPRHHRAKVTFQCTHCQEVMCGACVHVLRRRGGKVHKLCPLCSYPVEPYGTAKPKKRTFFAMLKQTVKLPFLGRKNGE